MTTEKRTMSIKRAMTRCNTISAQLDGITAKIAKYGAGSSKSRFDLVDTRVSRKKNHEQARSELTSLFQQFDDLTLEFIKIKTAIRKANLEATVVVKDKVMTLDEALTYQRHIQGRVNALINSYNSAVAKAERKVDVDNAGVNLEGLSKEEREEELAHVVYNVDPELIKEKEAFLIEVLTELNGLIDEANVQTQIEIE